jgi:hypothetical protein
MVVPIITLSTLLLASTAFADDDSSRSKLIGRWQQTGKGEFGSTWALEERPADSIHVTNSSGAQTVAEFECNTEGKECALNGAGRKSRISMWFNGPKLVELETRGSQVVKRRFSIAGDGDTMDLEIIPIAPPGKTETLHFKRASRVTAKQ